MPNTVIYANLLPFIAILLLMLFVKINPLFDKKQNKMFFMSAVIFLFMLIVISVDYTVSLMELKNGWVIRRITSFFNFSFSCLVPIFLIRIFVNRRINRWLYLPAIVNLIVCGVSMFVELVFILPEGGGYERGPLFLLPSTATAFYIIFLLIYSLKYRNERAYEALFLLGVILCLMVAMYLEVEKRFKFLSWDAAAVSLILYYLLLNINKSKIDPLTGANNRAMYVQKTESIDHSRRCIIAMIDINGFKAVNDQKGHDEGDRLLIQFAATAKLFMDKRNILYRIGGDEFAVISDESSMDCFKKRMDEFFAALAEYDINCAVGYEEYKPSMDIEDSIRAADMKMYEDKRKHYSDKEELGVR